MRVWLHVPVDSGHYKHLAVGHYKHLAVGHNVY